MKKNNVCKGTQKERTYTLDGLISREACIQKNKRAYIREEADTRGELEWTAEELTIICLWRNLFLGNNISSKQSIDGLVMVLSDNWYRWLDIGHMV